MAVEELRGKKVVITGGAGFIGSHIAEVLCDMCDVVIVDDLSLGYEENFADFKDKITFHKMSINDTDKLSEVCVGADCVFHLAGLGSVPRSVIDPISTHHSNATGTLSVLVAAKEAGVRRVVYSASSSAYGENPTLPKNEEMPSKPISPYGISKYVGEMYATVFYNIYGLETVSLRYMNIFGPRQNVKGTYAAVIPKFIHAIINGEHPSIFGDGQQTRDFTYIDNAVQANLKAATAGKQACGQVFNIACGKQTSLLELLDKINTINGTSVEPAFKDALAGDIKNAFADISKAKEILKYDPDTDLDSQLKKTLDWFKSQQ